MDKGGENPFYFYLGNNFLMCGVCFKAWEYFQEQKGLDSGLQLKTFIIVFSILGVFTFEVDLFRQELKNFNEFENWRVNFIEGEKEFLKNRRFKVAFGFFKEAEGAIEEDSQVAGSLKAKNEMYLLVLELLQLKKAKSEVEKIKLKRTKNLAELRKIIKNFPNEKSHIYLYAINEINWDFLKQEKFDDAFLGFEECLNLLKNENENGNIKDNYLKFYCLAGQVQSQIKLGDLEGIESNIDTVVMTKESGHLVPDKVILEVLDQYYRLGQYEKVLEYYLNLLEVYRPQKNKKKVISEIYKMIAQSYEQLKNFERAEVFWTFKKALDDGKEVVPQY
jgi:tetratricopeptide (TPR) repeat protein